MILCYERDEQAPGKRKRHRRPRSGTGGWGETDVVVVVFRVPARCHRNDDTQDMNHLIFERIGTHHRHQTRLKMFLLRI